MKTDCDFVSEKQARYALWTFVVSVGPLIIGSGRKPGEGLTFNSGYVFGRMHLTQDIITRILAELRNCSVNSFIFAWPLRGEIEVTIRGNKRVIDRQSMIALDCMNTFDASATAEAEIIFFYVSEPECRSLAGRRELHGLVFDLHAKRHFVEKYLFEKLEAELRSDNAEILRQFKYALLGAMKSSVRDLMSTNVLGTQSLKEEVLHFINENALDVRLNVDAICKEFHISRSTLYRLFSGELGVSGYITQRRLDQVYTDMLNDQLGQLSMKQIAFNYGFQNATVFKKHFMERFHFDPRLRPGGKE